MKPLKSLCVDVLGVALPAPRPSVGKGNVYMDKKSEHWKSQVRDAVEEELDRHAKMEGGWRRDFAGPVGLSLEFRMVRRPTKSKKPPDAHFTRKPDIDNLAKLVMDAISRSKAYRDDAVVISLMVSKQWSGNDGFAGVRINLWEIT